MAKDGILTISEIAFRFEKCNKEGLCFISLKPLKNGYKDIKFRNTSVSINEEYVSKKA